MKFQIILRTVCFFLAFLPLASFSASGGEIPTSFIFFQALNFFTFLAIIIYFVIKKVPRILKRNHQDYLSMNMRAKDLYQEAYQENQNLKGMIKEVGARFDHMERDLEQKVKEIESKVAGETEVLNQSINKGVQTLIELERAKLTQDLQNDLLNRMEDLCKSKALGQSEDSNAFQHKLLKKSL